MLIALVVASTLLGGILLLLSCFLICRPKIPKKCNANGDLNSDAAKGMSLSTSLDKFSSLKSGGKKGSAVAAIEYQSLVSATKNFDEGNVIGDDGSGRVYKACFNENIPAAVKKIHAGRQEAEKEFENEVELLGKIQHQSIVSLLGCCIHGKTRFLVYELMENGSLESHMHGKLTDKSDVYAFGVVLLEILLGRRLVERLADAQSQSIVTWATPHLMDRSKLPNIVDRAIRNTMDLKHLYQVAAIAVLCVQPEPSYRPLITDVLHSFIPLALFHFPRK